MSANNNLKRALSRAHFQPGFGGTERCPWGRHSGRTRLSRRCLGLSASSHPSTDSRPLRETAASCRECGAGCGQPRAGALPCRCCAVLATRGRCGRGGGGQCCSARRRPRGLVSWQQRGTRAAAPGSTGRCPRGRRDHERPSAGVSGAARGWARREGSRLPTPARRGPGGTPLLRSRGCGALHGAVRTAGSEAFCRADSVRSEDAIRKQCGPHVGMAFGCRLQVWLRSRRSISSTRKHTELQMKYRTPYPGRCFCAGCCKRHSCTAGSGCCHFDCWEITTQCSQHSQDRYLHPWVLTAALGLMAMGPPCCM